MHRAISLALFLVAFAACVAPPTAQPPPPEPPPTVPPVSEPPQVPNAPRPQPTLVAVHQANATVTCALPWASCDPHRAMGRPWATLVDTTDDGLNASMPSLVLFNFHWGQNHGQGGPFRFCLEADNHNYTDCSLKPTAAQYENRSMGFMYNMFVRHGSLWESTGKHEAWIEFPPPSDYCGQDVRCLASPTMAKDWWFRLEVFVVPGVFLL